ncbi:efflux RND transporter permease subunit [Pseudomonas sp. OIL-1]|uniref:efflux RND transporter permease subunit n=1 Tax=Pseudomonas sp. OIL-1 TaxID=2706126 RepID=UPI0013A7AE59|nr:efflux RND transporter permease subunit [Pseudomonas sp. OIL-1]QIB49924.1 efflux RND transporter permease subunit [Pseudomonas sp. OIL-1]
MQIDNAAPRARMQARTSETFGSALIALVIAARPLAVIGAALGFWAFDITTIVGLAPLAISSPFFRPLTLVIIFGLIPVSALALFLVPALYVLLTPADARKAKVLD